jgi:hypothetical protein
MSSKRHEFLADEVSSEIWKLVDVLPFPLSPEYYPATEKLRSSTASNILREIRSALTSRNDFADETEEVSKECKISAILSQ